MGIKVGIGQDSHRFLRKPSSKECIVAGLVFQDAPGLDADSDGDVVFHAICNAISSITHLPILGDVAIELCHKQGITDSKIYLDKALETLNRYKISHVALTIEGKLPKFQIKSLSMRKSIANAMDILLDQVGITFTTGDELTSFGRGEGLQCFCILTVVNNS
ncbi:MAG: 2-C-methyl-D-erythritol 2,4-cyclodiphosphate synthase [Simkaniaceae bacterium]|nr:2-C-methyl-D-erythritol 2,4-cyclodiphosphate synthase [Simkaniaceae bacterium]